VTAGSRKARRESVDGRASEMACVFRSRARCAKAATEASA
jgi:hypothetical protein